MNKHLIHAVIILFAVSVAQAADAPPPIPVVPKDAKALVGVPRPASDNVAARTEQFNRQAKAGGFDVLFIGDSITHLWEQHGKEVCEERIAPFGAANFGIGGDTTATVLWRLDHGNLEGALDPKVIVLMLGTNNIGWSPPEETAAALGVILEKLHTRFPKAKILLFAIFARDEPGTKLRQINDGVNAIISKFDGHWNIKYIDLNSRLAGPDGHRRPGLYWDATHLTAQGYEVWADALVPEFQAILKPAAVPAGRL